MEPMDLDHHDNLSYRSNPQTSTSPPLSPNVSDMEIDPNSPPPSLPYSNSYHCGNNQNKSNVVSSPSLESVNQSLSNILSLKYFTNDEPHSQLNQQRENIARTCHSAPPVVSPFFRQTDTEPKVDVNKQDKQPQRPRTSLAKASELSCFKTPNSKPKAGYGIMDDEDECDSTISQGQLSVSEDENIPNALRNRGFKKYNSMHSDSPAGSSCNDSSDSMSKSSGRGYSRVFKAVFGFILFSTALFVCYTYSQSSKSCHCHKFFKNDVLEVDLKTDLFGQHIASRLIQNHIVHYFENYRSRDTANFSNSENLKNCKPLVLSFHGWTGVGKNFGSQIISQSFTQVVSRPFIIPLLFPHKDQQELYANQIHDWITSDISTCSVNLFVLDEMDKAFPQILKGLLKAIKTLTSRCVSSSSPVIIILISNTHALKINQMFVREYTNLPSPQGRTDLKMEHFKSIFDSNSDSKLEWYTEFSRQGLIDVFVPFMPLEKTHVIECIRRELVNKHLSTDSDVIDQVLKELSFSAYKDLELSTTGCKRVADKVNYVIYNMK